LALCNELLISAENYVIVVSDSHLGAEAQVTRPWRAPAQSG
jgi:hypothetical protein